MGEFPTSRQEEYARKIADVLDIDLPASKTKQSYWKFIKENEKEFKFKQSLGELTVEDLAEIDIDESDCIGHILGDA